MKVTKNLQAEISALMNDYWNAYFRGDIEHWRNYLVDDYRNIGGTEEEIWNSKKEILDYTFGVIDQIVGKTEIRNKKLQIIPYDPYFMVHEFMDLFIKVEDEWTFYGKFRLSSLIQQTTTGWKVLHQHGSYPDAHTEKGEAFALDKLKKENIQLREAVKRRTIELESKNRELEIEASLERVRTVAMTMKKPDDILDICKCIFTELQLLGFTDLRNSLINFWDDDSNALIDYDYSAFAGGQKAKLSYSSHPVFEQFQQKIRQSKDSFAELVVEKDLLESWMKRRRDSGEYEDPRLENINALYYYFYSIGVGAVGISTFSSLTTEKINILKRFRNVFDLAYRRYKDVEKAEAQAKEAQTETALEKIRASAMAMHSSNELINVANILREQMGLLDQPELETSVVNLFDEDSDHIYSWHAFREPGSGLGKMINGTVSFRKDSSELTREMIRFFNAGNKEYTLEAEGEKLNEFLQVLIKSEPEVLNYLAKNPPKKVYYHFATFTGGALLTVSYQPPTEDVKSLQRRAASVFDIAYRRYLDLKKAEAQAKEAQIEAALEKVRSRSLVMNKSDELNEVVLLLFEQFISLGISIDGININILNENRTGFDSWFTAPGYTKAICMFTPFFDSKVMNDIIQSIRNNDELLERVYTKQEKNEYFSYLYENSDYRQLPEERKKMILAAESWRLVVGMSGNAGISIHSYTGKTFTDKDFEILIRFAKVFQQSYTRFLDLQKAEAQSREAQIQLALERIRARAMAMQKSDELLEVISVLAKQLQQLNIKYDNVSFAERNQAHDYKFWTSVHGLDHPMYLEVPYINNPMFESVREIKVEELNLYSDILNHEESRRWHLHVFEHSQLKSLPDEIKEYVLSSGYARTIAFMPTIMFIVGNYLSRPYSIEENNIIKRFAGVFEQSYTRFLDLQRAEAQAKEAEIELALERIRAKTMAMQKQDDLLGVTDVFLEQLLHLDFDVETVSFSDGLSYKDWNVWLSTPSGEIGRKTDKLLIPWFDHPYFNTVKSALDKHFKNGIDLNVSVFNKKEKDSFLDHLFTKTSYADFPDDAKDFFYSRPGFTWSTIYLKETWVAICKYDNKPFTEEQNVILRRFANTFGQTYTRFLDLKKAEAQAREAQIEAALERVRSRTIGMQKSEELREVIQIVFEQLRYLDFKIDSAHFNLNYKESDDYNLWTAAPGQPYPIKTYIPYFNHPVFATAREAKEKGLDFFTEHYTREEKNDFFEHLFKYAPGIPEERRRYILSGQGVAASTVLLNQISLWIMNYSGVPYSAAENEILKRFGKIFEQSHTRFLDLQKAEAQAREAIKQASLDRIRAEIASMRTTGDLETITPLIWNELKVLGVPFIRCGVFIMNDLQRIAHTYLSTPDGKAIAAFDLAYDTPGNISQIVHHWQNKKLYIDYWDEEAYTAFAGNLVQKGIFTSPEQYFSTLPGGGFYLHFAPFLQGMLYVGNTTKLSDDEINLIQCVANAFATAYARYEDFNKLEAAKKQVDNTLHELQLTQKQLIQSEKMASLGELTAGIAHEIQNPLNFVNNFSEINKELLHEMIVDIEKGNWKEVKLLAKNIIENEQKIHHHGTRADAIVKGMLQHSRTSSGQKEPTDINELADEYLRLAYHGLRAKDKTFNATLKTDYDETIGNINIIPQDIGRVILNLITNAFYAVKEKTNACQSEHIEDYKPTVTVSTKKINDKVEIKVADNGNGISQNIIDKIFQPFFSTKPAGQGTGLGLSLSYDIVKAHGGEIKVNTKEGEGSEFLILLGG